MTKEGSEFAVLHVINSFEIGGAEKLLCDVAEHFEFTDIRLVIAFLKGEGTLLKGRNIPCKVYDLSQKGKFSAASLWHLVEIIKRENIKIIHTHDPQSGLLARIAGFLCGRRFTVTTRHTTTLTGNQWWIYRIENLSLKYADAVIAISRSVQRRLLTESSVSADRIWLIYNAVDTGFYSPPPDADTGKEVGRKIRIGSLGRLTRLKGIDLLLEAVAILQQKYPHIHLSIAGGGEEEPALQLLSSHLGLRQISFEGPLSESRSVRSFLAGLDIFVLPSRLEGFGISLAEALSMERAVVGSDVDGITEIIQDSVHGLLFASGSAESLAAQIEILINDPDLRARLGKAGREKIRDRFSIDYYCQRLHELYTEIGK